VTRARKYLAKVPLPVIEEGSDEATFKMACRLVRGFGLSRDEAISVLWEWCGERPGWDLRWVAEKVKNAVRFGTEAKS
jgi:hypothetical protein